MTERRIHIHWTTVHQLIYLEQSTSEWGKHTEVFNLLLEAKFGVQCYNTTKSIEEKYINSILYLDFEDEALKDNFNWVIDNDLVIHAYDYHEGKLG